MALDVAVELDFVKKMCVVNYLLSRIKVVMCHRLAWPMYMCSFKAMRHLCTLYWVVTHFYLHDLGLRPISSKADGRLVPN